MLADPLFYRRGSFYSLIRFVAHIVPTIGMDNAKRKGEIRRGEKGGCMEGEKKSSFLRRHIIDSQKEAVKGSLIPREVKAGKEFINELFGKINPGRYKPSEFSKWANPEKTELSFREAMRRAGATEESLVGKHKICALSAYACVFITGLSTALGAIQTMNGSPFFGAALGASGILLSLALFFKYSLAALQIRKRDLNIGWRNGCLINGNGSLRSPFRFEKE
jgi:hypothetical protein